MKRVTPLLVAGMLALVSLQSLAAGDVELGRAKAIYCGSCHGPDGKREIPLLTGGTSHLAGMEPQKFVTALRGYRYGQRFHPMMQFFVQPLSDKDMEDLAAYYASVGPTLYERLGGKDAINMVVKDLLANALSDPRLKPRMSHMDADRCEHQLTDFLCEATGGPCKYKGRDMKTAHAGANVTEAEWQGFSESLMKTLDRFNVAGRERDELLQMVVPLKGDIVGH
jgi:hemoglobin